MPCLHPRALNLVSSSSKRKTVTFDASRSMVVVKCGASGHNIRSRPSLKAASVGMLTHGNAVTVQEYVSVQYHRRIQNEAHGYSFHDILSQFVNNEGTWVRIDDDSMSKYCFDRGRVAEGEAWSLAVNKHGVTYMKIEQDLENDGTMEKKPIVVDPSVSPSHKGFEFSVPSVSHEGFNFTTQTFTPGTAESGEGSNTNPFIFGSYNQHDSPGLV